MDATRVSVSTSCLKVCNHKFGPIDNKNIKQKHVLTMACCGAVAATSAALQVCVDAVGDWSVGIVT